MRTSKKLLIELAVLAVSVTGMQAEDLVKDERIKKATLRIFKITRPHHAYPAGSLIINVPHNQTLQFTKDLNNPVKWNDVFRSNLVFCISCSGWGQVRLVVKEIDKERINRESVTSVVARGELYVEFEFVKQQSDNHVFFRIKPTPTVTIENKGKAQ